MSAVVETESDADFRKHVLALNEQVKKAGDQYRAARDIALARKKQLDEIQAKMSEFINDYGKPDPQKKFNFGSAEETDNDLDLGTDAPPVAAAPPEVKDESPSIETLDIPAKLVQLLMDNDIRTVNNFTDLIECKNPKLPQGPESIEGCGKKSIKQLAAAYEALKFGDAAGYEPPLPEEVPAGVPEVVAVGNSGEVISSSVGEVEQVDSIDEEPASPDGPVKIRSKTAIDGAIELGKVYDATVTEGEACVEINGDPIMLMEGEYELVS